MKISIITACYNSSKSILDTLESINSQTHEDIELIIIDGGSTDNTLDLLKSYNNIIYTIVSEKDNGIYDAMNKGIRLATGDIIGILNSDDLYFDDKVLFDISKEFENENDLEILFGNIVYVKENDIKKIVRKWISKKYFSNYFEWGNVPPHPSLFVKKNVYSKAGMFDLNYTLAADYEFMLRIFKKHNFNSKYINRFIVKMRLGGATNKNIRNIIVGNIEIIRSWKDNQLNYPFWLLPIKICKRLIQYI